MSSQSGSATTPSEEGIQLFLKRQFKEAAEKFREAIKDDAESGNLWNLLAQAEANQGNYDSAVESITEAIKLDPNTVNWQLKGTFLLRLSKFDEAREAVEAAIELDPIPVAYILRGQIEYNQRKFDESMVFFEKALELDPENPLANQMTGLVLFMKGSYSEVIPLIEKALEVGHSDHLQAILDESRKRVAES
ncbi:MAG: tetratricopeptide repeat protein [Candidatus Bathyarchaeota archaeon]|nr:tetratricopeptide repeat protein [Candidatus Bathyarchaeota archaeon]